MFVTKAADVCFFVPHLDHHIQSVVIIGYPWFGSPWSILSILKWTPIKHPMFRWVITCYNPSCPTAQLPNAHDQARVSWLQMRALGRGFGQGMPRQLRFQRLGRGKLRGLMWIPYGLPRKWQSSYVCDGTHVNYMWNIMGIYGYCSICGVVFISFYYSYLEITGKIITCNILEKPFYLVWGALRYHE